jgi:hypothetical protein
MWGYLTPRYRAIQILLIHGNQFEPGVIVS